MTRSTMEYQICWGFQCTALLYSQGPGLVNLAGVMVAPEEKVETVADHRIFFGSWEAVEIGS